MGSTANEVVNVDFLVVGAGPSGASLAAFMAQNGLKGLVIARAPGTANTPRAHVFNPFAIETLRDIGLEDDAKGHSTHGSMFQSLRWAASMIGEEYGKVQAWGAHPNRLGDLAKASPCNYLDLPQSYLEPILVRYASTKGFQFRFSTQLIDVAEIPGSTDSLCTIHDRISNQNFQVRTKFVFGADGSHSKVAQILDLKYNVTPRSGVAFNILFRADIGHLVPESRYAGLHSIIQPKNFHGMVPIMRLVRPWNQWILVCNFEAQDHRLDELTMDSPEVTRWVRQAIGDESIDVEIERLDRWNVNDSVAQKYSVEGRNVFILGDAAHRHPPAHANGSNTCIQDAYNLGWKVAYVSKGWAGRKLLESYNDERQPVGATLVREANEQFAVHLKVWKALGQYTETAEEGERQLAILSQPTEEGEARRQQLHEALEGKRQEAENLGLSMNQWYKSSAVYLADEKEAAPVVEGDPVTEILVSSYPGFRLPHAWVDVANRHRLISTHDLAGHGAFCLFIGHRGKAWREAAMAISKATGIPIKVYGIGLGLDYIDVYRDWYSVRGVDEGGCVLVRPDRFVAWRSKTIVPDCQDKLQHVLDTVLSRE